MRTWTKLESQNMSFVEKRNSKAFYSHRWGSFLKSNDGQHKRVFFNAHKTSMKLEVKKQHDQNHYEQNRMYDQCKALDFLLQKKSLKGLSLDATFVFKHSFLKRRRR